MNSDPQNRPNIKDIHEIINRWVDLVYDDDHNIPNITQKISEKNEIVIRNQFLEADEIIKNQFWKIDEIVKTSINSSTDIDHIYTSKLINTQEIREKTDAIMGSKPLEFVP
ncbi:hypothetical protein F8M41_005137 [Gigaspora margarita]|uniref:Uncharacterized protein n=1 Tax=Gigaspora margarita TaxID=4874 RepID=A0A8H4A635_GIGMA|nr:hypothetical protein F8M41_005137 [Gigaspora margarita]